MNQGISTSAWSLDMRVMLRPATAYRELAQLPATTGKWLALRRPMLFAFVLGCTVSFAASSRLTVRLVVPAAIYAVLLLLIEILALTIVRPKASSQTSSPPFPWSLDLFFAGFGPWLLWLIAFAAVWAFASPVNAFRWTGPRWDLYVVGAIALWSCYIDFCFFRYVFQITSRRAASNLLIHRVISWTLAVLIFSGSSIWSEFARSLRP
jgi:hypothetical protein